MGNTVGCDAPRVRPRERNARSCRAKPRPSVDSQRPCRSRPGRAGAGVPCGAQSIEPRFYSNTPVGVNFLIAGVAYTSGGLSFDSSLPLADPQLTTWNPVVAYARSLDVLGMSAKFDVAVPYTWLSGSALYRGDPITRDVDGFGDPLVRMSVNFYGAPALTLPEFRDYRAGPDRRRQRAGLRSGRPVRPHADREHRRPPLVRQARDRVLAGVRPLDAGSRGSVTLFSTNHDFYNGNTRAQDPLYSVQANAIHNFDSGIWASIDATYFMGGRTTLAGEANADLQQNWRAGGTLALPLDARHFDQALRQHRALCANRQQLRPLRDRVAVPLGRWRLAGPTGFRRPRATATSAARCRRS